LFGRQLIGAPAHARLALGIARTFQQVAIFPTLSCRDNVALGLGRNGIARALADSFDAAIAGPAARAARRAARSPARRARRPRAPAARRLAL